MQRLFYGTAEDLLAVFDRVEARRRLAYTLTGLFDTPALTTAHSGGTIPTLRSPAPHPGATAGHGYLVTAADEPVMVREVPQRGGGIRYAVDQLANPRSVAFMPGGIYPPNVRLYGRVATISDAEFAEQLFRAFAAALDRLFRRVGPYQIGRQAEELWRGGQRLTIGADSPPEYDLAVPEIRLGG